MKIKILTFNTKDADIILKRIVDLSAGNVEVVYEVGDKNCDIKASSLSKMSSQKGKSGHLMLGTRYVGARHQAIATIDFEPLMQEFADHLHRRGPAYRYVSHKIYNLQDYFDYYHILLEVAVQKIKDSGATHILFFNIPHMAYDTIFHQAGKLLGLKILILSQSIFPGKYFSMSDIQHLGCVSDDLNYILPAQFSIKNRNPVDLFYMKGVQQGGDVKRGYFKLSYIIPFLLYIIIKDTPKIVNFKWIWSTLKYMHNLSSRLPSWRDPFSTFFHVSNLAYFEYVANIEQDRVDFKKKFVYFPLHLQPEMTTSALGGVFKDQALAIEELARILPEDVYIYVKDNPKQRGFSRGAMFFHRLNRIHSVKLMPSTTSTEELIDHSICVATITGTAGWEALCKGKVAICFGLAWYRYFPGVVRFDNETTWKSILNVNFNNDELEQALARFLGRCHDGHLYRHYSREDKKFDRSINSDSIAKTVLNLLNGNSKFTFDGS